MMTKCFITNRCAKLEKPLVLLCFVLAAMLTSAAHALDKPKTAVLRDVDESAEAFSFREGGVVSVGEGRITPANVDLVFDLPHGLAANNSQLDSVFTGRGGILDMGEVALDDVKQAPDTKFRFFLEPDQLIVGHTYCVLTADGKHYGKFHLLKFSKQERLIEFTWQYQPKDTRKF